MFPPHVSPTAAAALLQGMAAAAAAAVVVVLTAMAPSDLQMQSAYTGLHLHILSTCLISA
jgi:hypothetical protein